MAKFGYCLRDRDRDPQHCNCKRADPHGPPQRAEHGSLSFPQQGAGKALVSVTLISVAASCQGSFKWSDGGLHFSVARMHHSANSNSETVVLRGPPRLLHRLALVTVIVLLALSDLLRNGLSSLACSDRYRIDHGARRSRGSSRTALRPNALRWIPAQDASWAAIRVTNALSGRSWRTTVAS